jgi:hypothetical protein
MKRISISVVAAAQYDGCVRAIKTTMAMAPRIDHVYWCSDRPWPDHINVPVTWVRVRPYVLGESFDLWYNYISLRLLPAMVDTDFDIIVQPDGFAVNSSAWTDEFFDYDYIGAVWPHMAPGQSVGNGGFSWRSRRLYDALVDWQPSYQGQDWPGLSEPHYHRLVNGLTTMPEDALLASPYRRYMEHRYGLRWAPEFLANQWSLEYPPPDAGMIHRCFGFHGPWMAHQLGIELTDLIDKFGNLKERAA